MQWHEELSAVRQCISGKPWDQLVYKRYLPCSGELCTIGKLILRGTRIVIPKKLMPRVLSIEEEPIQQQSVSQEPNVAETKVPAEGAHSYQTRDSTQEIAEAKPGTKLSQGLLYLTLKDTDSND